MGKNNRTTEGTAELVEFKTERERLVTVCYNWKLEQKILRPRDGGQINP